MACIFDAHSEIGAFRGGEDSSKPHWRSVPHSKLTDNDMLRFPASHPPYSSFGVSLRDTGVACVPANYSYCCVPANYFGKCVFSTGLRIRLVLTPIIAAFEHLVRLRLAVETECCRFSRGTVCTFGFVFRRGGAHDDPSKARSRGVSAPPPRLPG